MQSLLTSHVRSCLAAPALGSLQMKLKRSHRENKNENLNAPSGGSFLELGANGPSKTDVIPVKFAVSDLNNPFRFQKV
jgi:hypothetical protein